MNLRPGLYPQKLQERVRPRTTVCEGLGSRRREGGRIHSPDPSSHPPPAFLTLFPSSELPCGQIWFNFLCPLKGKATSGGGRVSMRVTGEMGICLPVRELQLWGSYVGISREVPAIWSSLWTCEGLYSCMVCEYLLLCIGPCEEICSPMDK